MLGEAGGGLSAQDQWCVGTRTARYCSATFDVEGLLGALEEPLARSGYTHRLHAALRDLQAHLRRAGPV